MAIVTTGLRTYVFLLNIDVMYGAGHPDSRKSKMPLYKSITEENLVTKMTRLLSYRNKPYVLGLLPLM